MYRESGYCVHTKTDAQSRTELQRYRGTDVHTYTRTDINTCTHATFKRRNLNSPPTSPSYPPQCRARRSLPRRGPRGIPPDPTTWWKWQCASESARQSSSEILLNCCYLGFTRICNSVLVYILNFRISTSQVKVIGRCGSVVWLLL